jgi:photosystem II stability/assembly factor-like uncharacterized protein
LEAAILNHLASEKAFLATTGNGLARAALADGAWKVEYLLPDQPVTCLSADPLGPGLVYAGIRGGGVQRSNDGGRTWRPAGLPGQIIKAVAASPIEPGVVYAGAKPALIYVSRDGGGSWAELEAFRRIRAFWWLSPAEADLKPYIQSIALSPSDPKVIVVGIEAGAVLRSVDGGRTWQGHRPGALRDCHSLLFHLHQGDWVYEGGGTGAGAACSRDGGRTWRQPRSGLDRHYGWAVAADPAQPEIWYASLSPGPFKAHTEGQAEAFIFRSTGGAPWEKLNGGLPQPLDHMAYALLTDPAAPGHLYAGLSSGDVWHSTDHGTTWTQLPFNLGGIHRALILL